MATQAEILQALRNADAAGDTEAATRLAKMLKPEPEFRSVPDDFQFTEDPDFKQLEEPGLLSRMFAPSGNIGDPAPLDLDETKTLAGITGSSLAAIAAPYLAVPSVLSKARFLGPVASFFTKNAGKAAAAGGGGVAGETLPDALQGKPVDPGQMVETAAEYGASELGGEVVSRVAGKALAPAKNKVTDQAKKLLEFAKKEKIPIGAGALVPGMTEKIIRGGTDNFIPSRLVNQHYRQKMITRMNELMGSIPEGVGPVLGKEESSLITTEAFRAASNAKQATAKRLREEFLQTIGHSTPVTVKNTEALLKKISGQVKDPSLREYIEVELASIANGAKTAEMLEQSLNQLGAVKPKGADKKYLTQIRQAIQDDFRAVGADMEKLSNANNFFVMNSELLSNPVARMLMKGNMPSTEMTRLIFKSGNEEFVKKLAKELPKETWDSLRAQNLANQLENFSSLSDKVPGARVLDRGDQLVKWIENNRSVLKAAYDPETVEALENFAKLAKASKTELTYFGKDISQFGQNVNFVALGGAGYANPYLLLSGPMMMGLANEMMRPNGLIKRWLTTGLGGGDKIGEAAKLGGRTLVSGEDDDGSN